MSGGAFDYSQFRIRDIHEQIQETLDRMGKEKPKDELRWFDREYLEKYPEEKFYANESEAVKKIFSDAVELLKKAEVYAHRIDWFISGDDGEDSLIQRLKDDLDKLS